MSDSQPASKRGLPVRVKMRHDTHFVESLDVRHGAPVGKLVPLSSLEPDPNQPRATMGDLADLVASIRDKGVLEPILVRATAEPNEDETSDTDDTSRKPFRIISGERRYRAALEAGLYEVPVIEMDVTDGEALEIALIENLQRKDLTPFEEAEGYRSLMQQFDLTQSEVADKVGKSRTVITEALVLLDFPPRVRDTALALGLSSKTVLREVAKAGSEQAMIALLEEVAEKGLSRDDLRARGQSGRRGGSSSRRKPHVFKFKSPDKSYSVALRFRSTTVDREDLIRALEQVLSELRDNAE